MSKGKFYKGIFLERVALCCNQVHLAKVLKTLSEDKKQELWTKYLEDNSKDNLIPYDESILFDYLKENQDFLDNNGIDYFRVYF